MKNKLKFLFLAIVGLFCFSLVLWPQMSKAADWVYETVDDGDGHDIGRNPSIAIDSLGYVHMTYIDSDANVLIYTTNKSGSWDSEIIGNNVHYSDQSFSSMLALDSFDYVHVGYFDSDQGVMHATNKSGTWENELALNWANGNDVTIAIDSFGYVHMSYIDNANYRLRYITNKTGSWEVENIDTEHVDWISTDVHISLAIDSNDYAHISYYGTDAQVLRHATNQSGSWVSEIADDGDGDHNVGRYSSIAIDSSDYIYISYTNSDDYSIKYATNKLGSWADERIDDNSGHTNLPSIALDDNNNVHISYYNSAHYSLKYVTNQSGEWENETVKSTDNHAVGANSAIDVDSSNNAHIGYYDLDADTSSGILKYATTSQIPSTPSLSINSGSTSTDSTNINLSFSSYGAATYMIIGNQSDLSDGTAIPFNSTVTHTLTSGDGEKTVYARLGNGQGASSIIFDTITLDTSVDDDDADDDSDDGDDPVDENDTNNNSDTPQDGDTTSTGGTYDERTDSSGNPTLVDLNPKILVTSGPGEPTRLQAYSKGTTDGANALLAKDITGLFPDSYLGGAGIVPLDQNNNGVLDQFLLFAIHEGGPQALVRGLKADGSLSSLGQMFVFQNPSDKPGASSLRDGLSATSGDFDNDGYIDDAAFCLTGNYAPHIKIYKDVSGIDNWELINQFTLPNVGATGCNLGTFQYDDGADEILITPNHGPSTPNVYIYTVGGTEKEVFQAYDNPINQGLSVAGIEDRIYTTPNNGTSQVNAFDKEGTRKNFWWVYDKNVKGDFTIRATQLDPSTDKQELLISPVGSNGPHILGYKATGEQKPTPNFFAFGDKTLRNGVGIATIENWHGVN